jgi:hypothetical protein
MSPAETIEALWQIQKQVDSLRARLEAGPLTFESLAVAKPPAPAKEPYNWPSDKLGPPLVERVGNNGWRVTEYGRSIL